MSVTIGSTTQCSEGTITKSTYGRSSYAYGSLVGNDTQTAYAGACTELSASNVKTITIKKTSFKFYSTSGVEVSFYSNMLSKASTNTGDSPYYRVFVSLTTSSEGPMSGMLDHRTSFINNGNTPDEFTYTFSTPYSGNLYLWYIIPKTKSYSGQTYYNYTICIVRPSIDSTEPSTAISSTLSESGTSSITVSGTTYKYFNLSNANSISGTYSITSDYALTDSSISLNGVGVIYPLTKGSTQNYTISDASPTAWKSNNIIRLSASNGTNTTTSVDEDHTYKFYSKPTTLGTYNTSYVKLGNSLTFSGGLFRAYCLVEKNQDDTYKYISLSSSTLTDLQISNFVENSGVIVCSAIYTPTSVGTSNPSITLTDNFTGNNLTATHTFPICCYSPPTVSYESDISSGDIELGDTVTFTNTSTETKDVNNKYIWYDNDVEIEGYIGVSKSTSLVITFTDSNNHFIKLRGYDNSHYDPSSSDTYNETEAINYKAKSYIKDISLDSFGIVYVTRPVTFRISDSSYVSDVTYDWYDVDPLTEIKTHLGTGRSITQTYQTTGSKTLEIVGSYSSEPDKKLYQSFSVLTIAPTISFKCYSDASGTTEITSSTPIADSSTKVYLQNNSTPIQSTSPTYNWYFNSSEITPVSPTEGLPYFIPSVSATGTYSLELGGSVDSYSSSGNMDLTMVSPAPYINSIVTSQSTGSLGDTIYCSLNLTEIVVGATYSYSWTLDGQPIGTSSSSTIEFIIDSSEVKTYTITATASVIGTYRTWTSNTATATVNVIEYKDPTKRYTIVIRNGNNALICTRSSLSSNRFNNLQFEKRLNETGGGSFDLLINSSTSDSIIASGSDIIIYDNASPIYYGIITGVNNNNISPYSSTLSKKYYSIDFSEGCRKLSYTMCESNGSYTKPYSSTNNNDNLLYLITGSDYIGSVDDYSNEYTFSISYQDMLSQIDSLSEQCGARYRTNIHTYCDYSDVKYSSIGGTTVTITRAGGWSASQNNSLILCRGENHISFGKVLSTSGTSLNYTQMYSIGTVSSGDDLHISIIKPNPIVDFKQAYYSSVGASLIINKTTYNVDDVDSLNKHYGSISCTSPQMQGVNITRTIDLNSVVDEDYKFDKYAYVTNCNDTKVIDCYLGGDNKWRIVIDGTYTYSSGGNLYYPYWDGAKYIYGRLSNSTSSWDSSTYSINGISRPCTIVITTWLELPGQWTQPSIIGMPIINNVVIAEGSGISNVGISSLCIGGTVFNISSIVLNGTTYTITLNLASGSSWGTKYLLSIPNGTLILENYASINSPKYKYPDKTLSVMLQRNMDYGEVGLITSNLARYGSNFTENISGTCSIKNFVRPDGTLPHVGEHCTLQYLGITHDYELQSFTVNTQTMTVDYVMGMKPINIGDVVYRITQNMTTNITTN